MWWHTGPDQCMIQEFLDNLLYALNLNKVNASYLCLTLKDFFIAKNHKQLD